MPKKKTDEYPSPPTYSGLLSKPVEIKGSFLKESNSVVLVLHKDQIADAYADRLPELEKMYGYGKHVSKTAMLESMVLRMAMAHIPGFKIRVKQRNRGGRPQVLDGDFYDNLYADVQQERDTVPRPTLEDVFEKLVAPSGAYKKFSFEAIKTRYAEARSRHNKCEAEIAKQVDELLARLASGHL